MNEMKYKITVFDYELDENGTVIGRDGGDLIFNDADDFIMMWNYFEGCSPIKEIEDDGRCIIMRPKEIGPIVTDYQVHGESYKILKERNK